LGVPLLVPERATELSGLATEGRCGLTYRDVFEAIRCLEALAEDTAVRRALGAQGRLLAARAARRGVELRP
jgi:molybdenum-dependent DNA-binding transcriptional regulator ModE